MTAELTYLDIRVPGRDNVREPLNPPHMRLIRATGRAVVVTLNEAQLTAIITDAAKALDALRLRRDATVPGDPSSLAVGVRPA